MTAVYFIIILGLILIIHELGHLVTAKLFGVYCKEFSIGMGPLLYSKQGKETKWSLRLIPIGGYVAMAGDEEAPLEANDEEANALDIPKERTLPGIAKWKQAIVMAAGSFMNIVLAFVAMLIFVFATGQTTLVPDAVIDKFSTESAMQNAGFMEGDKIVQIVSQGVTYEITDNTTIANILASNTDQTLQVSVERNGEIITNDVTPNYNEEAGRYLLGIQFPVVTTNYGIVEGIQAAFALLLANATAIIDAILNLVRGIGLDNLGGPVGIFQVTGQAAQSGLASLILLLGMLSINVGLFNLVPLPIFDGGRILILAIEAVIGRDLNEKVKNGLMLVGIAFFVLIFVFATWNDISRLFQ